MGKQSRLRSIFGAAAVLAAVAAVLLVLFARDSRPSAASIIDAWTHEDGPARVELLAALAARPRDTERVLERRLRGSDAAARYEAARLSAELGGSLARKALLELASEVHAPDACRLGALYALRGPALSQQEKAVILRTAVETGKPLVRRAALAALSGNTDHEDAPALSLLLESGDPITSVYAARLLAESGHGPGVDFFAELLEHQDYLVRQEACDALGRYDTPDAGALLEKALARETNASAARAARLAFGLHRSGPTEDGRERFFRDILAKGDDDERLWALDTLKDLDPAQEEAALKAMAAEPSDFGLLCRVRLVSDNKPASTVFPESKHHAIVHNVLAAQALEQFHAQPGAPQLNALDSLRLTEAIVTEDAGVKPLRHANNPLTGRGFFGYGTSGGPSSTYMKELLGELDATIASGDVEAGIDLAGRVLHLIQDMTSPLHVFCVSHPFNTCLFEDYWRTNQQEVQTLLGQHEIVAAMPGVPPPGITERMDAFSAGRLEERLAGVQEGLTSHFEALAWLTYFTASHWGELHYTDEASTPVTLAAAFNDGNAAELPNVLHTMFDGKIRYHASWWRDYFEIEDRLGNTYSWNKCFLLDGFRPCSNAASGTSLEGHVRDRALIPGGEILRVTGRFYFTQRGFRVPHCHPVRFADGVPTDMHLTRYYGETLFPLAVAYSISWLNDLASHAPSLFDRPLNAVPSETAPKETAAPVSQESVSSAFDRSGGADEQQGMEGSVESRPEEDIPDLADILYADAPLSERVVKALQSVLDGCLTR